MSRGKKPKTGEGAEYLAGDVVEQYANEAASENDASRRRLLKQGVIGVGGLAAALVGAGAAMALPGQPQRPVRPPTWAFWWARFGFRRDRPAARWVENTPPNACTPRCCFTPAEPCTALCQTPGAECTNACLLDSGSDTLDDPCTPGCGTEGGHQDCTPSCRTQ